MNDTKIANQTFTKQDFLLEEKIYEQCTFNDCNLIFTGKLPTFNGCNFNDSNFTFAAEALNTIEFMKGLYISGGAELIEAVFDYIRNENASTGIIH